MFEYRWLDGWMVRSTYTCINSGAKLFHFIRSDKVAQTHVSTWETCLFAHTAHSFTCSPLLALLACFAALIPSPAPELMGERFMLRNEFVNFIHFQPIVWPARTPYMLSHHCFSAHISIQAECFPVSKSTTLCDGITKWRGFSLNVYVYQIHRLWNHSILD